MILILPTPNQTISFLKQRFEAAGIHVRTQHGQNFLIDLNLLGLLIQRADVGPRDVVLEVGTGTGSLTARLAPQAAAVVTVEIDPRLHQLASEELIDFANVTLLNRDVLWSKNTLDPDVLAEVAARMAEGKDRRFIVVANLPYSVATPLISNLLDQELAPDVMTITIQRELAERIVALPGTREYGSLAAWVQSQCQVELIRLMPPEAFWPRPKVTSAIVQIRLDPERRGRIIDRPFWHHFVRTLFLHRRKFLRGSLLSGLGLRTNRPSMPCSPNSDSTRPAARNNCQLNRC